MPTAALARLFKAVVSLFVLVAAVGGLPLLLAWATPVIWAASRDDLVHLLDRQDTGSVFLLVLVVVGWTSWVQFAFCAVRELAAQLRGRQWHAPRGLGTSQRAAALLVGSILVLLPTGSALASDAHAVTIATAPRSPGHVPAAAPATDLEKGQAGEAGGPSYTVRDMRPAESLWSIAEKELGDGERWREIADLNEGHTMAGGQVFRSSSFLQPGWTLAMPADTEREGLHPQADGLAAADGTRRHEVVTVHAGDSLSKIAEAELGDQRAWPRLFNANKDKPQPSGLPAITDPDLIYAGQHITVPGTRPHPAPAPPDPGKGSDHANDTTPTAPPSPHDEHKPTADTGQDTESTKKPSSTTPSHAATPAPQSTPTRPPAASPSQQPARPSPTGTPAGDRPSTGVGALNLRTVLGAGALLAAAITAALALRRTLQRRRRGPGETIAITEASPAEAQLAAAAEPSGAARLDTALRTMVRIADRDGRTVPVLRAARLDARRVHVLPEDLAAEPQPPFIAGAAGWWQVDDGAELLDEEETRAVAAPYPALVTVGTTEVGDLVLADLARLPALLLDGNLVHISEVCTSLALELGMSPWGHDVEIVAVGFGEDLPRLLPNSRIAHMRQPEHALRDLTERLLEVHQMPETAHHPYVVLCAAALDDDTAWQFADVLGRDLPIPVTLVAPATTTARHFPEADILTVSAQTPQCFDLLGIDILVQRLDHAAYRQIVTALAVSGQPATEAQGPWQHVPGDGDLTQQTAPERPVQASTTGTDCSPSPSSSEPAGSDSGNFVFPALLQASADPAVLTLPTSTAMPVGPHTPAASEESGPGETGTAATPHHSGLVEKPCDGQGWRAPAGPEIRVLGPVEVDGVGTTGHGPRTAQLAALLYFRPGRTSDALCADMDPISPWSTTTLNARLQGLRRALGNDEDGNPYVPRRHNADTPYRLADTVTCDWTHFLQLTEHALPHASKELPDLEAALALVRGRPFGTRPPAWAQPHQQEMITRITDVAHTVATLRTAQGPHHNLSAARRAITTGLDVDDTAELLYRDAMLVEAAAGNRPGIHQVISRIQQVNAALDFSPEPETEHLIHELLHTTGKAKSAP
ncbi:LysM peptidoglycan-binding domain-containing protein [Streptomyces aureus]